MENSYQITRLDVGIRSNSNCSMGAGLISTNPYILLVTAYIPKIDEVSILDNQQMFEIVETRLKPVNEVQNV